MSLPAGGAQIYRTHRHRGKPNSDWYSDRKKVLRTRGIGFWYIVGLRLLTLQPYIFVLKDPLLLHKYHMTQYDGFFLY